MAQAKSKSKSTKKASGGAGRKKGATRQDKSLDQFRDALERSITLSRERIEEVVDDAVKRGRMTRGDANELLTNLIERGRRQSEDLLKELERLLRDAQKQLDTHTGEARKRASKAATRAAKAARDAADEPLARADRLRRRAGVGSGFPISGYDTLTAAQVKARLGDLSKPELRKVRTAEKKGKARKSVLAAIEKKLA